MTTISPVKAFTDNYIWVLLHDGEACAVDPGDAAPLQAFLAQQNLTLSAVLVTHHHGDHIGGLPELVEAWPGLRVIGPPDIGAVTEPVADGDTVRWNDHRFMVMAVPGHTLDHLAYHGNGILFCGDTLFAAGCGRLFEGSPAQMAASLASLTALPPETDIYPAHEYTLSNLDFAHAAEPGNTRIIDRIEAARSLREQGLPTLPCKLRQELETNPFLRTQSPEICLTARQFSGRDLSGAQEIFTALRAWKDVFKPQHL
jgi:hydroxyacylglutathione hydrolase